MAIIENLFQRIRNFIFAFYRFFRRKYSHYWLLYLIALVVVTNELIIPLSYQHWWPYKGCGDLKNYYKVLLVADPQILGENTEHWIARWDSDRYLRNWFNTALRHTRPDVIIFLGDLMDEGNQADDQQFSRYLSRFKRIFQSGTISTVFVPGDNDIGGEDLPVYVSNFERFEKFFGTKSNLVERYENLEFYKVNKLMRIFPNISNIRANSSTIRIAVSHIPLLGYSDDITEKVIKNLRPQLIFSGHDHKSIHFVGDLKTGETTFIEVLEINSVEDKPSWRFQNGEMITNEIIVPTCSYRMGVNKIGYGLALIDKKGSYYCYMILWLPQRLHQLYIYLCCIILICINLIFPFLLRFYTYFMRMCTKIFTS